MEALLGEPGRGGGTPFLETLKVTKGRLWGWASLFWGAQLGKLDFEIRLKGSLEVECVSMWELCEGNLEGGLP